MPRLSKDSIITLAIRDHYYICHYLSGLTYSTKYDMEQMVMMKISYVYGDFASYYSHKLVMQENILNILGSCVLRLQERTQNLSTHQLELWGGIVLALVCRVPLPHKLESHPCHNLKKLKYTQNIMHACNLLKLKSW